ncbi:MAG: cytoplasmic protein [Gammaproteobacteria bacterium]|nr:cytoplasmic protein [Gammaproteobacteria bacterium]MDH3430281.1 cytoplasmic protein [Gammaproteobacteria bacterium]
MRLRLPLLVVLVLLSFTAGVAATSALDPVRVAPHIYELAFENDRVRVLKKTIRNGETPPIHSHPDRVTVYLNPCAWLIDNGDGSERMESYKFGEPAWSTATTHGGETASVIQQCSVIEVELK